MVFLPIVVILMLCAGVYLYSSPKNLLSVSTEPTQLPGWNTYTDQAYKFSISLPSKFKPLDGVGDFVYHQEYMGNMKGVPATIFNNYEIFSVPQAEGGTICDVLSVRVENATEKEAGEFVKEILVNNTKFLVRDYSEPVECGSSVIYSHEEDTKRIVIKFSPSEPLRNDIISTFKLNK